MTTSNLRSISVSSAAWRSSVGAPANAQISTRTGISYPEMVLEKNNASDSSARFVFPFPPEAVSYSDLGASISQIDRPGRKPLVVRSNPQAMKVSLNFLVAVPKDGLFIDVESSLRLLIFMANAARPVSFRNFDSIAINSFSSTGGSQGALSVGKWSIIDLQFESIRRNSAQKITSASVTVNLVENSNPKLTVVDLPRIKYVEQRPTNNPPRPSAPTSGGGTRPKPPEKDYIEPSQVVPR